MTELDERGRLILRFLVSRLPMVRLSDSRTFVGYKEVHEALNLQWHGQTYGDSLKRQGLESLAIWLFESGKPGITGIIIDRVSGVPSNGYFAAFGRGPEEFDWWLSEIRKSKEFSWDPFLTTEAVTPNAVVADGWSKEELRESVRAYLDMQSLERAGKEYVKTDFYSNLASEFGRTAEAFEYRMQNISYVLAILGREWLSGLKPAKNVGVKIAAQIEELIAELEARSILPLVAFEMDVGKKRSQSSQNRPQGRDVPDQMTVPVTQYQRDAAVKAWVLAQAKGTCDCCGKDAPFLGVNGFPFLEVHHVRKLAEGGADCPDNAVAVCPNCHRELHYGGRAKDLVELLYLNIPRLKRK